MLISPSYKDLNRQLHESNKHYGVSGHKFAQFVVQLCEMAGSNQVLDYGCGKATLSAALGDKYTVWNYDPAIEGLDELPPPRDVVVCTDVMEHIEPECLDAVLDDLRRCTKNVALITIACRPAKKVLADGRNAHLIIEDYRWWMPRIWQRFDIVQLRNFNNKELVLVVR